MSNSSAPNKAASSPPAPARISRIALRSSAASFGSSMRCTCKDKAGTVGFSRSSSRCASALNSGSASRASASAISCCALFSSDDGFRHRRQLGIFLRQLAKSVCTEPRLRQGIAQLVMPRKDAGQGFGKGHWPYSKGQRATLLEAAAAICNTAGGAPRCKSGSNHGQTADCESPTSFKNPIYRLLS